MADKLTTRWLLKNVLTTVELLHTDWLCYLKSFLKHFIILKPPSGSAPPYISELLVPYDEAHCLRSSGRNLSSVQSSQLKTKGDCVLGVGAPGLWTAWPEETRAAESLPHLKSLLKTLTHKYKAALKASLWCFYLYFISVLLVCSIFHRLVYSFDCSL